MLAPVLALSCVGAALASPGYVKLDLEHEQGPMLVKRQSSTDDLSQEIVAGENGSLYWLNLTIGTPPQSFRLQLDTGSSDVVVPNSKDKQCKASGGCPSGSYTPDDSSTYELLSEGTFNNTYGDGTEYLGDYFTDVLSVGGIEIKEGDLIIGLANELVDGPQLVNDGTGLVGVGYQANSGAIILTAQNGTLPSTVVSAMVASGDIGRQAYSLFLGSQESGKGHIIFGGVDPSLYTGDLVAVQVLQVPIPDTQIFYTSFTVALTGVSITDDSGTRSLTDDNFAVPVLLDSGNTLTNLPNDVLDSLNGGFGVTEIQGSGFIPCGRDRANSSVTYHFGGSDGPSISVPLSALIAEPDGGQFSDGEDACQFKVEGPTGGSVVLGDSFMRSGYFVFDLENNQVALAQAATSAGSGDKISAIESGTDIPGCSSTNTFSIDAASATIDGNGGPAEATGAEATAEGTSVNPATPTFDLGAAGTETSNPSGGSSASGSSSGSGSGNAASGVVVPNTMLVASSCVMAVAVGFAMVLL